MFNLNGEIIRSISRSSLRREVLKYLANIYPDRAYLTEIAFTLDRQATTINGALTGTGHRYSVESSLLALNLVSVVSRSGKKYYQLNRPFADEVLELINEKRRMEIEI